MAALTQALKDIKKLSNSFEQLKIQFQFYFQGIEKRPPSMDRDRLQRKMRQLLSEAKNWNTGERFKLNTFKQKFHSHNRMWNRTLNEIELGTYKPHLRKLKMKEKQELESQQNALKKEAQNIEQQQIQAPQAPAQKISTPPPKRKASNTTDDAKIRKLYDTYMRAKKRTGERSKLTFETLKAQIEKQVPKIKAKHKCQNVDFKVVMKDGKASLKAIPK